MTIRRPARLRVLAIVLLAGAVVLGGAACSAPAPQPAPAPPPTAAAPVTPAPATGPTRATDQAACSAHIATATAVNGIAKAAQAAPILPAAVALFLLDARSKAAQPMLDPTLAAAQSELVAAVDDLDAQGKAALPPGGNPAQDPVHLDMSRITAAVAAVGKACTALG
ncbi:hypothetical protein [Pseudonocardia sp. GCM10023141]|uniref:hypothetical protein n=1 Tax=Pseudonocardia sp. GCM10023141 TaxID=3252653 RepID=UPI003611AD0C